MSDNLPAIPDGTAWDRVCKADGAVELYEAGEYAMELVDVPGVKYPVPRFFFDLPWGGDNDQTVHNILVNLITAPDIEKATAQGKLRKLDDICGEPVRIFDIRALPSEAPDANWGAYLSLAVSIKDGPQEVFSSGHQQVCITLWRCFCEGRLPVSGVFKKLGTPTKGRKQPIGFQVESAL